MIRKWTRETETDKVKLDTFCFCSTLEKGSQIIGVVHLTSTIVIFVVLMTFIITTFQASSCFGPGVDVISIFFSLISGLYYKYILTIVSDNRK